MTDFWHCGWQDTWIWTWKCIFNTDYHYIHCIQTCSCPSTLASESNPQMHYILCNLLLLEQKQKNNLGLDSSISKIAVFQPNSRSGCIGTISPNSASLTVTKALSLHLLSAIDLESPSLYGDFSLSPVLNAHLSASLTSSVYLFLSHAPSLVLSACILTKCASFLPAWKSFILMWEEVAALPASSLLIQDNVRQWRSNGILLESH